MSAIIRPLRSVLYVPGVQKHDIRQLYTACVCNDSISLANSSTNTLHLLFTCTNTIGEVICPNSLRCTAGSRARAIEKCQTLPVDAIILDLEDAVAPDAKADARDTVFKFIRDGM